ncbi:MAG: DNA primase [Betaproteobacteria bacterium]|nr:DNA primase [Betaproteobacteria bacterium]
MIPPDFIQQLLARVDIVDVVDKHVKLKKSGQNYSACCPFHSEKTPSFSVSPTKQFYHCFGCGVHGTAISFLMEYAGMGFRDAVRELADGVGLTMPQEANRGEAIERAKEAAGLGEVMNAATHFYRRELKNSPKAIEYFKSRGVSGEIAAKFALGYAPDDWQGLKGAVEDYSTGALKECGLVIDSDEGRRYDRFRDRVMFPIHDARGNVIGFGGRVIGAGEPKYLNSPETPLFEKGRELYGLFHARRAIRDLQTAIVVEGYMDVVALAQNGIENAVATLGTATTPTHVQKLLRMADNLVFCFDGDNAGRKAAWRALEQSLPVVMDGKDIRFLFLPAEDDPDTFVRRLGKDAFLDAIKSAKPLSSYLLESLSGQVDLTSAEGRSRLLALAKPLILQVPQQAPGLAMMLRRQLAEQVGLSVLEVQSVVPLATAEPTPKPMEAATGESRSDWTQNSEGGWRKRKGPARGAPAPRIKTGPEGLEVQLIALMLTQPHLAAGYDLTATDDDSAELGAAGRVASFIRDHDFEVSLAQVVESFRESPDEPVLDRAVSYQSRFDGIDTARLDLLSDFQAALSRIQASVSKLQQQTEVGRLAREKGLG